MAGEVDSLLGGAWGCPWSLNSVGAPWVPVVMGSGPWFHGCGWAWSSVLGPLVQSSQEFVLTFLCLQ